MRLALFGLLLFSCAEPRPGGATQAPVSAAPPAVETPSADAALVDTGPPDAAILDADSIDSQVVQPAPNEAPEGMALVPGGTFTMGADDGGERDERPAHAVTVNSYFLDLLETTHAEYESCVTAKVCEPQLPRILAQYGGLFHHPQKPVDGVSAFDAEKYCAWKGKRLPREAEYERAVRGDDGRKYPWGNEPPTSELSVYSTRTTLPVGSKPLGKGPYGHLDLAGNVWEWLADPYDPYAYRRATASLGIPGDCKEILAAQNEIRQKDPHFTGTNPVPKECERGIRGGAYNYSAGGLRSTNRIHHPPNYKLLMTGFRCAKDL